MAKAEQVSGAWRALLRACFLLVFAICGVSEVTPTFIPLVLEAEARKAQKGLWADPHPMPPWEWRR
jgi:endonuclease YncB( thermonuclease family)